MGEGGLPAAPAAAAQAGVGVTAFVLIAIFLVSCAALEPVSRRPVESRVYDSGQDLVQAALLTVLESRGYDIAFSDQATGQVETAWLEGRGMRSQAVAEVKALAKNETRVAVGFKVEEGGPGKWKPVGVKISLYESLFEEIDLQIYRERFRKIERKGK
jgi:hypothetical protein